MGDNGVGVALVEESFHCSRFLNVSVSMWGFRGMLKQQETLKRHNEFLVRRQRSLSLDAASCRTRSDSVLPQAKSNHLACWVMKPVTKASVRSGGTTTAEESLPARHEEQQFKKAEGDEAILSLTFGGGNDTSASALLQKSEDHQQCMSLSFPFSFRGQLCSSDAAQVASHVVHHLGNEKEFGRCENNGRRCVRRYSSSDSTAAPDKMWAVPDGRLFRLRLEKSNEEQQRQFAVENRNAKTDSSSDTGTADTAEQFVESTREKSFRGRDGREKLAGYDEEDEQQKLEAREREALERMIPFEVRCMQCSDLVATVGNGVCVLLLPSECWESLAETMVCDECQVDTSVLRFVPLADRVCLDESDLLLHSSHLSAHYQRTLTKTSFCEKTAGGITNGTTVVPCSNCGAVIGTYAENSSSARLSKHAVFPAVSRPQLQNPGNGSEDIISPSGPRLESYVIPRATHTINSLLHGTAASLLCSPAADHNDDRSLFLRYRPIMGLARHVANHCARYGFHRYSILSSQSDDDECFLDLQVALPRVRVNGNVSELPAASTPRKRDSASVPVDVVLQPISTFTFPAAKVMYRWAPTTPGRSSGGAVVIRSPPEVLREFKGALDSFSRLVCPPPTTTTTGAGNGQLAWRVSLLPLEPVWVRS